MRRILYPAAILLTAAGVSAQEADPPPPAETADPADQPGVEVEEEEGGGRIVNGYPASAKNAAWQAQIFAKGPSKYTLQEVADDRAAAEKGLKSNYLWQKADWEIHHRCGGALIAPNWIVTAAHCAKVPGSGNFLAGRGVRLGTLNIPQGAEYRIDRVIIHKDYKKVEGKAPIHDIALMRIVPLRGRALIKIAPIRILGSKPGDLPVDANPFVTVTGWGLTGAREHSMALMRDGKTLNRKSSRLMEVALSVKPHSACATRASYRDALIPEVLCAGSSDGRDTCNGDSGGPMTRAEGPERVLVGLVSFGYGCGIKGVPGLYVNATAYRKWIADAMTEGMKPARAGRVTDF